MTSDGSASSDAISMKARKRSASNWAAIGEAARVRHVQRGPRPGSGMTHVDAGALAKRILERRHDPGVDGLDRACHHHHAWTPRRYSGGAGHGDECP